MFEKEAEEYAERTKTEKEIKVLNTVHDWGIESLSPSERRLFEGIQDRERAREQGFQYGAEFGYNKANEWHEIESKVTPKREISKQYMPKNKEKVLLKYHFSGDDEVHISDGYYDAYDFEFHIANNPKYRIVCVIAWKEIVLPKGE
jgi:hypothetical protein